MTKKQVTSLKLESMDCYTVLAWLHANQIVYDNRFNSYYKEEYKIYCDILVYLTDTWDCRTIEYCQDTLKSIWAVNGTNK